MRQTGFDAAACRAPEGAPVQVAVPERAPTSLESLDVLVALEFERIRRLALRFGLDGHEADDAVQEVFARAWSNRGRFHGASKVTTWLTRIAINEFSTRLRGKRRWSRIAGHLLSRPPSGPRDPRQVLAAGEAHALAADCLSRLPARQREAFVLRYLEDLSCAETAEILGVSENVVRARAFSARKKLRSMLGDVER